MMYFQIMPAIYYSNYLAMLEIIDADLPDSWEQWDNIIYYNYNYNIAVR